MACNSTRLKWNLCVRAHVSMISRPSGDKEARVVCSLASWWPILQSGSCHPVVQCSGGGKKACSKISAQPDLFHLIWLTTRVQDTDGLRGGASAGRQQPIIDVGIAALDLAAQLKGLEQDSLPVPRPSCELSKTSNTFQYHLCFIPNVKPTLTADRSRIALGVSATSTRRRVHIA